MKKVTHQKNSQLDYFYTIQFYMIGLLFIIKRKKEQNMWQKEHLNRFKGALFEKVITLIEDYIEQGILVSGERLPSERELANRLLINRSTVVHALAKLTERNVLVRKQGSGTFVNPQKWGVQVYPTINWHLPANFNKSISLYQQKALQLKAQSITKQTTIYDLSNGDLPVSFIPKLTLPEMSSQELIYQEKNADILQMGLPSLKTHITNYMAQQFNMRVKHEEILITSGTQQALFLITQGLLKPGDAIGVEAPSYFYSLPLFQAAGVRIYGIKMDDNGIIVDDLQEIHQKHRLKWIFINPIFQNPTGRTMSPTRKKSILAFCWQACIGIVEDDAYSALYFDDNVDYTPVKKIDRNNQVIYLGSLSKYIGRSVRIGWMIAPAAIIQRLSDIRQHIDSGLSILPQLLAEDYLLNHYQSHHQHLRQQLKIRRDQLIEWIEHHYSGEIQYQTPQGGFHLYIKLPVAYPKQEDEFLNQWLVRNIIVSKGENFGDQLGMVRLCYGHMSKNLF